MTNQRSNKQRSRLSKSLNTLRRTKCFKIEVQTALTYPEFIQLVINLKDVLCRAQIAEHSFKARNSKALMFLVSSMSNVPFSHFT